MYLLELWQNTSNLKHISDQRKERSHPSDLIKWWQVFQKLIVPLSQLYKQQFSIFSLTVILSRTSVKMFSGNSEKEWSSKCWWSFQSYHNKACRLQSLNLHKNCKITGKFPNFINQSQESAGKRTCVPMILRHTAQKLGWRNPRAVRSPSVIPSLFVSFIVIQCQYTKDYFRYCFADVFCLQIWQDTTKSWTSLKTFWLMVLALKTRSTSLW